MPKIKIPSLFVLLSFSEFHRETTLRTPRELPATAPTKKVLFVKILPKIVNLIPKKVDLIPEKVVTLPKTVDLSI